MDYPQRLPPSAGIAIGPILFILAIFAIIATVMATGTSDFQNTGIIDRISADISSQANMIRNTINNCNLQYQMALSMGSVPSIDGYPASDPTNGTLVANLLCDPLGTAALWGAGNGGNGTSGILLPPTTNGFNPWMYVNAGASGGRCIWTTPTGGNPVGNLSVVTGLTRAASKFNSSATVTLTNEVVYNPAGTLQRFVVWIATPSSTGAANSNCTSP